MTTPRFDGFLQIISNPKNLIFINSFLFFILSFIIYIHKYWKVLKKMKIYEKKILLRYNSGLTTLTIRKKIIFFHKEKPKKRKPIQP